MQANLALGLLETSSIAVGVVAADAMCKTAGVELLRSAPLPRGKYMIIVSGPVGEVESAMLSGLEMAKSVLVANYIIRNVHSAVLSGLDGKIAPAVLDAVGMIETKDALPAFFAADAACKAAHVELIEVRLNVGGGKGYFSINGEVGAVRSAISAGAKAVGEEALVSKIVIPQAHGQLAKAL